MLEVAQFVFQDFRHWLGTLILITAPTALLCEAAVMALKRR